MLMEKWSYCSLQCKMEAALPAPDSSNRLCRTPASAGCCPPTGHASMEPGGTGEIWGPTWPETPSPAHSAAGRRGPLLSYTPPLQHPCVQGRGQGPLPRGLQQSHAKAGGLAAGNLHHCHKTTPAQGHLGKGQRKTAAVLAKLATPVGGPSGLGLGEEVDLTLKFRRKPQFPFRSPVF
jgi:hypothetical protein